MSLKIKLTSLILGVIFAMSMMIVGVLSISQVNLGVGGNVTFTAKGVNCTISSGSLNYGEKKRKEGDTIITGENVMKGFTYSTTTAVDTAKETAFKSSWTGLELMIDENENVANNSKLEISFSITNNADAGSNEYINVTIGAVTKSSSVNMKEIVTSGASVVMPQGTEEYKIIFEVQDRDIDGNIGNFNVNFLLEYSNELPVIDAGTDGIYKGLKFEKLDGKEEVGVRATSAQDISSNYPDGVIEIPDEVKVNGVKYPVTKIEANAFYLCMNVTEMVLSNNITSIGSNAFSYCNFTSFTIPASVSSIGSAIFQGCANLATITVDSGNSTYYSKNNTIIETATKKLVAGCKTSTIASEVVIIGVGAFQEIGITSITIPANVKSIEVYAFIGSGLTSAVFEVDTGWYNQDGLELDEDVMMGIAGLLNSERNFSMQRN